MPGPNYFNEEQPDHTRPAYFEDAQRPKRANFKKHERDVAKRTGDRLVAGSGNQPGKPMDVTGKRGRECKAFRGAGGTISGKWLANLVEQALRMGKRPVLELRFEKAIIPAPQDWVMIPARDYDDLMERAGD